MCSGKEEEVDEYRKAVRCGFVFQGVFVEIMQTNVFGGEEPVETAYVAESPMRGPYQFFRQTYRYRDAEPGSTQRCANCEHFLRYDKYFKCLKQGVSSSICSDIRAKAVCNLFKNAERSDAKNPVLQRGSVTRNAC